MNKKNLKHGFSLIEMVIIVVIIGVMFLAASSLIRGRNSSLQLNKSAVRLKQAYDLIMGTVKYNGLLPVRKDNATNPDTAKIFENLFNMKDGYGNNYVYIHGNKDTTQYGGNNKKFCDLNNTGLTMYLKDTQGGNPTKISNVAFVIMDLGKNMTPQWELKQNGNNYDLTVNRYDYKFDDKFMYATIDDIKYQMQCKNQNTENNIQILTKVIAPLDNITDNYPKERNDVSRNIIYTNKNNAKWCITLAKSTTDNYTTHQIDVYQMNTSLSYESEDPLSDPIKNVGDCQDDANYTTPSYGLLLALTHDNNTIKTGKYKYIIFAKDPNNRNQSDFQPVQITVPKK